MTTVKKRRFPIVTVLLFTVAIALLLFSSLGGASAALTYSTEANAYVTEIGMKAVGIVLVENKQAVKGGELLADLGESDGSVIPGKSYGEELFVVNSGSAANGDIDEYVRVVIYKYWENKAGEKDGSLDPDKIVLNLLGGGWVEDVNARTDERTVLYYTKPLAVGEATAAFMDSLTVDGSVVYTVAQNGGANTVTTYIYDGAKVCLDVEADGVQTHHAEDAILSAWGRSVSIAADGTLSLN